MSDLSLSSNQAGSTNFKRQISANDKRLQVKGKYLACNGDFFIHRIKKQDGKEDSLLTHKFCKPCWQKRRDDRQKKTSFQPKSMGEANASTSSGEFPFICAAQRTLNSFLCHHFVLRTMYAFPCLTIFSMALKVGCRDLLNPILLSV